MVEFPPVYKPKPYNKPTAHLKQKFQVPLDDGAEIATFIYISNNSPSKNPRQLIEKYHLSYSTIASCPKELPIIFLHGNGEEHGIFGTIIDAVCQLGFTAIGIDSRDQGLSTRGTASFTYEQMAHDVYDVLKHLGISQAHIVGFSDGAIEGILLARDYPEVVASLLAIGANLKPDALGDISWLLDSIEKNKRWAAHGWEGATLEDGHPVPSPTEAAKIVEHLELMVDNPHINPASVSTISAPTTVMAGEYDEIFPEETRRIAEAIPDASLVFIPGAPHNVPKIAPNAVIRRLLTNISRSSK